MQILYPPRPSQENSEGIIRTNALPFEKGKVLLVSPPPFFKEETEGVLMEYENTLMNT
jgi:hypothetical protein